MKAYRWKGPVFAIAAINGEGCRELDVQRSRTGSMRIPRMTRIDAQTQRRETPVVVHRARCAGAEVATPTDEHRRRKRPAASSSRSDRASSPTTGAASTTPRSRAGREEIAELSAAAREIVLVSSGAIAEGIKRLGWSRAPARDPRAAGRSGRRADGPHAGLRSRVRKVRLHTAQILLTHEDLADRRRYLNARTTLRTLLALGVIPIINENDTVTTDEIRVGDNDTLGALVANLIEADVLVLLTDQQGLYTADPRRDPRGDARCARRAPATRRSKRWPAAPAARSARGGMLTKVLAAKRAARSRRIDGHRVRARGERADAARGRRGRSARALDRADRVARPRASSGSRITCSLPARCGSTPGAVQALARGRQEPAADRRGRRRRQRSSAAKSSAATRRTAARSRADSSTTARRTRRRSLRKPSAEIESILGYVDEAELIHRDNLVLLG